MSILPFCPRGYSTFLIANTATPTTPVLIHGDPETVVLTNTDTAAIAYVEITRVDKTTDTGRTAVVPVANLTPSTVTSGSFPVLPGQQVRLNFGRGHKTISIVSSAATGNLLVSQGIGN